MFKILVVEDDAQLNRAICVFLRQKGYNVAGCLNVNEAYDTMYGNKFDLVISDIMMPDTDGLEFARTIRKQNEEMPIIFVTAKSDMFTKRCSFGLGVDDYMVKPINFEELSLRISALFRRAKISANKRIEVGDVVLDTEAHTVHIGDEPVYLSVREFNIIYKLLSYPKKPFTRMQLMDEFWDSDTSSGPRTVDVYMTRLRNKFASTDAFKIVTVHGLGYKAVLKDEE
ncbi:MAG: response regulator transcription factor [Clostridia bacterium]|nr:response regulator transcription factor [Clostridia bacterium]